MSNTALYLALRAARAVLPVLPLSVAYRLADLAGLLSFLIVHDARRAIRGNLAVVTGQPAGSRLVGRLARDAFANDAKNWVDTLRIHRVTEEELVQAVSVHGWDRLADAAAADRGVILVTMHLGNYDLVGQLITAKGLKLTIPVERMRPPALFDLLMAERRSKGINVVAIEEAPRAMLRALRSGEVVAVAGDRNISGRTVDVEMFGRTTAIPRGPVSLARRTGAPLLLGVGIRLPSRLFQGFVSEPIEIATTGDAEEDDRANAQRLVREMEGMISRFPGQWLVFTPVWPDSGKEATLTVEHTEVTA
jgi:KDO2-lipid IV(A) lauroyltransferase